MTNRDPNVPDFLRKVNDMYTCYQKYFTIADYNKLNNDIMKPDIELVCKYEHIELRRHIRSQAGIHYTDFIKVPTLIDELEILESKLVPILPNYRNLLNRHRHSLHSHTDSHH